MYGEASHPQDGHPGDLLVRDARIVDFDAAITGAGATDDRPVDILIRQGEVAEVGPRLTVPFAIPELDAAGRYAIPGLWDHHVHLGQWAAGRHRIDTAGTHGPAQVVARVGEHVAAMTGPADEPIVGWGHRSATWSRLGTVAELDAVAGAHPTVLIAGDGHNGWLNSAALTLLEVAPRIGPLDEAEWFEVYARMSQSPAFRTLTEQAYGPAMADAAALGVVGLVDFEFGQSVLDWEARRGPGIDVLRVRVGAYADDLDAVIAAGYRTRMPVRGHGGRVTMGPLKLISDGSLNTATAYCHHDYPAPADPAHPRGKLNHTADEITALMRHAHAHDIATACHAIGDAAVDQALDCFEAAGARGTIEHAQLLSPAAPERMARLRVGASVQPAHLLDDRDVTDRVWPDRAERSFTFADLARAGVPLLLGSDAPVSPLDPWLAMAAAVWRSADDRDAWLPGQALTPAQALAASVDGAQPIGLGSRGDLALLDRDPLCPGMAAREAGEALRTMTVAATILGGRITHQR